MLLLPRPLLSARLLLEQGSGGTSARSIYARELAVEFTKRTYATQGGSASVAVAFSSSVRRPHLNLVTHSVSHQAGALHSLSRYTKDPGPVVEVDRSGPTGIRQYIAKIGRPEVTFTITDAGLDELGGGWEEKTWGPMTPKDKLSYWLEDCHRLMHLRKEASQAARREGNRKLVDSVSMERREDKVLADGTPLDAQCLFAKAMMFDAMDRYEKEWERVTKEDSTGFADGTELHRLERETQSRLFGYAYARDHMDRKKVFSPQKSARRRRKNKK